jgi:hypothetical protein
VQETIGGQHDRQGHLGQIHPLGEHLGAHQDISLAGGEAFEQAAMAIPSPGGVMVKTQQPQVREFAGQLFHHPLGSRPERLEGGGAAMAAAVGPLLAVVAPMAAQPFVSIPAAVHG